MSTSSIQLMNFGLMVLLHVSEKTLFASLSFTLVVLIEDWDVSPISNQLKGEFRHQGTQKKPQQQRV